MTPVEVAEYFAAATQAALILAAYRAPFRGRSTPVNAWWGSFDLAVSLFSGLPARPPSDDFIMRNAMDAQEVAVGWWPGDARHGQAAFYAYAHPATEGFDRAALGPDGTHWDAALGEYVLEWDDVRSAADPRAAGVEFARSAFRHACAVCEWDKALAASADSTRPRSGDGAVSSPVGRDVLPCRGGGFLVTLRPCLSGGSGVASDTGRCTRPFCVWTKAIFLSAALDLGSALCAAKPRVTYGGIGRCPYVLSVSGAHRLETRRHRATPK